MKITRKRYIITRNNQTEILCGLSQNYTFKRIDNIGNTAIKTYQSENTAITSFKKSWRCPNFEIEVLEVEENYRINENN